MSATRLDARSGIGSWGLTGAIMGVIAGVIFAMFEMIVAAAMGQGFFAPLRMIGAIALGEGALPPEPSIGLAIVVPVGLSVHMMLSAIYGAVFGGVASVVSALRRSRGALIGATTAFGLVLWLVNFYVVAPVLFPWFLMSNPVVQFLAHTFFFGTALGLLLAARTGEDE